MARNEEKAQSMLYRFREAMLIEAGLKRNPNDPTPLTPETCDRLGIAEQARKELVRDISKKITRIQDKSLDELQVRKLNDELNEMVKKKYAWDQRIHELGGIDRKSIQLADRLGLEAPNIHGYYYFGRAKELPGVEEALNPFKEDTTGLAKKKQEMLSRVDYRYFGFEEDQDLTVLERNVEENLACFDGPLEDWVTGLPTILPKGLSISTSPDVISEDIPTQAEVQKYLMDRRKEALLKKLESA